jgi:hypothetical protein
MSETGADGESSQELQAELTQVDADLAEARRQLDALRDERSDPTSLPDTADDATLIRDLEDREEIIAVLEQRRATLTQRLA